MIIVRTRGKAITKKCKTVLNYSPLYDDGLFSFSFYVNSEVFYENNELTLLGRSFPTAKSLHKLAKKKIVMSSPVLSTETQG